MSKFYFICLIVSGLFLSSCWPSGRNTDSDDHLIDQISKGNNGELSSEAKDFIARKCIKRNHHFADGQTDNLYGRECIEGKHLVIKTNNDGELITTTASINFLNLEKGVDFINRFYNPSYEIVQGGDDWIPFLKDFLPAGDQLASARNFFGSRNTEYRIIFQTLGNYLILNKASKNLDDIPYIERTAMEKNKDGDYKKTEDGYFMVPFLGYSIKYCSPDVIESRGQRTYEYRAKCDPADSKERAEYLQVVKGQQVSFAYVPEKKDLFPSEYFDGEWFFSEGDIETSDRTGELSPFSATLIEFEKTSNSLDFIDVSGNVERRNQKVQNTNLPVIWQKYEMNTAQGGIFKEFGERLSSDHILIQSPYLRINFEALLKNEKGDIEDFLIGKDYFSITMRRQRGDKRGKYKMSFLRKSALDDKGFVPRRWFQNDDDRYYGILFSRPQDEKKEAEFSKDQKQANRRMIRFNINSQNTIKWHFSKNSSKDPDYRALAREAVKIYDRAFQIITAGTGRTVRVELIEGEDQEKDLGDIRYNLINLVKTEDLTGGMVGLFGAAPPYVNPDTGQIIGVTANIFLQNILEHTQRVLRHYMMYEIYQKDTRSEEENKIHVVGAYLKNKIENEKKCSDLKSFIKNKNEEIMSGRIKEPHRRNLMEEQEKQGFLDCAKAISKNEVLKTILHELGHNFGLSHNFKCSYDSANYYESIEEVKKYFPNAILDSKIAAPASACIMDYLPILNAPAMTVIGKYDLAALKFLYMDQIATGDMGDDLIIPSIDLEISEDPTDQKDLEDQKVLSQRKVYLHCPDYLEPKGENFFCRKEDYGSAPLELAEYYIEKFKQNLQSMRYVYDSSASEILGLMNVPNDERGQLYMAQYILNTLHPISEIYFRWMQIRDRYLSSLSKSHLSHYIIPVSGEDDQPIKRYEAAIDQPPENEPDSVRDEYISFHSIRESINDFMLDLVLPERDSLIFFALQAMKCRIKDKDGNETFVDFNFIREQTTFRYQEKLYAPNCRSAMVTELLKSHGLEVIGQKGLEDFDSYYSAERAENRHGQLCVLVKI